MNEIIINIYNTIIKPISDSTDFFTVGLAMFALIIAYYTLLHNRPRIEITPKFGVYPLKESLKHIKLLVNNTGTNTAYNIRIKSKNETKDFFYYPEDHEKYENLSKLTIAIDKIAENERSRRGNFDDPESYTEEETKEIKRLNDEIKKYKPTAKYRHPRYITDLDIELDEIGKALLKIEERESSIKNFLNLSANVLIPAEKIICHLVDFDFKKTYIAEIKLDISIQVDISNIFTKKNII